MLRHLSVLAAIMIMALLRGSSCEAQMIHSSTPFQTIGSSYSEGGSVAWSLNGPNWFANFGGGGPLLPPFGPADPGGGLSGGVRLWWWGRLGEPRLQFWAEQSSIEREHDTLVDDDRWDAGIDQFRSDSTLRDWFHTRGG